ncbi:MAG TPA: hypothetical protein VJ990_10460 [Clostridia bacterium]|nr:hypothetical protein [Clostridia bacterium]
MKRRQRLLGTIIIALAFPVLAWANMAIPIENPDDNKIMFDPDPGISMIEENVRFTFDNENWHQDARVDVRYVLRNEEAEDKSVDMIFVTPPIGESGTLEGRSGGNMIETAKAEPFNEMPQNWKASCRLPVVEPVSGETLEKSPSHFESGEGQVWGTRFSVDLPAGKETMLEVSYGSIGGIYRYQEVINQIHSQVYYLTPASFYSGEPRVTLEVLLPNGMDAALYSSIPLENEGGNVYRAALTGLPEEEWLFTFADKSGLFLGTNKRALNNYPVLAFFALSAVSAIWLWKSKKKKVTATLFLLAGACSLLLIKPSYGSLFLLYMASPLIGIAFLIFAAVWIAKRVLANRRKL